MRSTQIRRKRCRRYWWEDDTKRGAGHSEWSHQACEHQESGYDHEAADMVPDVMDRFTSRKEDNVTEEDVNKILDEAEK